MITLTANDFSLTIEFQMFETDAIIGLRVESSAFVGCGKLDVSKNIIEIFEENLESLPPYSLRERQTVRNLWGGVR